MSVRLKRVLIVALAALSLLVLGFLAGPRVSVPPHQTRTYTLPADLDAWLAERESHVPGIRPGLEKSIQWADPVTKARTKDAIVYLHGFSASRGEISPVVETLGRKLNANVFFTRLTGHGEGPETMGTLSVDDWLDDGEEALAIGHRLGERVTVIGLSTGSTLGLWLASRRPDIHAQVLMSPNFGPKDKRTDMLLWPWGRQIAHGFLGDYRTWTPENALHKKYWTTHYRVEGLLQMMALVRLVNDLDLSTVKQPTLMMYTDHDTVLDVSLIPPKFAALGAPDKKLINLEQAEDHVLTGDAKDPGTNARVIQEIETFLAAIPPSP